MSNGVVLKKKKHINKRTRNLIRYIEENKDKLEAKARRQIESASQERNKKTTKTYKVGFEYKDRNW
jgi:hypothetical protein